MRQTVIVATAALAIAIVVAVWGNTIIAQSPKGSTASTVLSSMSIMQMMKDAKNLPEERFDAH